MYACLLNCVELFDRARKFALQRLQVINLVLELRHAELTVIKKFEALITPGQTFGSQIQARAVDALRRNEDRRALPAFLYLVIHLVLAGILRFHICEQGHHVRLAAIDDAAGNNGNEYESCGADDHISLPLAVIIPELQVALFPLCHFLNPFASICLPKPCLALADRSCPRIRPACA